MTSLSFLVATSTSPLLHPPKLHPFPSSTNARRRSYTSCNTNSGSSNNTNNSPNANENENKRGGSGSLTKFDRRNALLGLGGLYGASTIMGRNNTAIGAPVTLPDLSKCHLADSGSDLVGKVPCCPPYGSDTPIVDYQFPSRKKPLRVRRPAHLLEKDELDKYKEALAKMRELTEKDPDDPRGWMQQANVHCQYCNGAFDQVRFQNVPIQVHYSWLFAPWHRWYLHFYERILGSLIGDDSFALPFWNWDSPDGMNMPNIFVDSSSSLYDDKRNHGHFTAVMDMKYSFGNPNPTEEEVPEVIKKNLLEIHDAYTKDTLAQPDLFMGDALKAGEEPDKSNSPGSLERIHNDMHMWVGPEEKPHFDMGNFYTAGRDPLFYSHHSNVDRMWNIYRTMRGNKTEFNDADWLDATFVFVDENKQLVKVKVGDCLNPFKMRYTYEDVELPWAGPRRKFAKAKALAKASFSLSPVTSFGYSPRALDSTIRVLVERPKKSRSKNEKEDAVETLVINGIQAPLFEPSRFDVYVTTPIVIGDQNLVGVDLGEYVGGFVKIPHHGNKKDSKATKTKMLKFKTGINNLLEEIDAEGADKLVVSLVPRLGSITVGGVTIDLVDVQN